MSAGPGTMAEQKGGKAPGPLIDDFVNEFYNMSHYERLAKRVQEICRNNLPTDIRAIYTYRAKEKESLRKRLHIINEDPENERFESLKDIKNSIRDLAGVRIALYIPMQKTGMKEELENLGFASVQPVPKRKTCSACGRRYRGDECLTCRNNARNANARNIGVPTSPEAAKTYQRVFAGYVADHYWVKLTQQQANHPEALKDWKDDHVVEIQVVPILSHAWAEVEHDIIYKSPNGEPGEEERNILDSLDGYIKSSEVLLDHLHKVHLKRAESQKGRFANKADLATFLDQYIGGLLKDDEKDNLELKMLFRLLKAIQKDYRQELKGFLAKSGFRMENPMTKLEELGPENFKRYSELDNRCKAFSLAKGKYVRILVYIIEGILANISNAEVLHAQKRARQYQWPSNTPEKPRYASERLSGAPVALEPQSGLPSPSRKQDKIPSSAVGNERTNPDDYRSYRCRVLLSSLVWMGQISQGRSVAEVVKQLKSDLRNKDNKALESALDWACASPSRFKLVTKREQSFGKDGKGMEANDRIMETLWNWFEEQDKDSCLHLAFEISKLGAVASFPDDLALLRK